MRRAISIIFYVIAGWMLSGIPMISSLSLGIGTVGMAIAIVIMLVFALLALGLGLFAEPGSRREAAGIVLMVSAAIGVATALSALVMISDPGFKALMPADSPKFELNWYGPFLTGLPMAAIGWLLWTRGKSARLSREASVV